MSSRAQRLVTAFLVAAAVLAAIGSYVLTLGPAVPQAQVVNTPTTVGAATASEANDPGAESFSFAVLGDNRDGPETYARLLAMVQAGDESFLINTGDLVSNALESQYLEFRALMARFTKPFYPVPGNHDVALNGTLTNYLKYSGAPALHYSFDRGQVHFSMANTSLGDLTVSELAWLEADLAGTTRAVKIIVLHHPPFDPLGGSHILGKGVAELMAMSTKHQVRYVLAGHIHEYAREMRDGVTYLVTGGGGAPLAAPPDKGGFYHYVRITVRGEATSDEVVRLP